MEWWNLGMVGVVILLSFVRRWFRQREEAFHRRHAAFSGRYYIWRERRNTDRLLGLWTSIGVGAFSLAVALMQVQHAPWLHAGATVVCAGIAVYWFRQPKTRTEWEFHSISD